MIEEAFAQKRMTKATFSRLVQYVRPYRRIFFLNLFFTLLATVSQLLGPKFIQLGIDKYLANFTSMQVAMRGILLISAIYLGNLLLGWFLSVLQVKSAIRVGQQAMNDMRLGGFRTYSAAVPEFFDRTHQGRIISRADTDIDALDRILTWGANQLIASAFMFLGVIVLMVQYDWRLCLAVSVVFRRWRLRRICSRSTRCLPIAKCESRPRASPRHWPRTSMACESCRRLGARI